MRPKPVPWTHFEWIVIVMVTMVGPCMPCWWWGTYFRQPLTIIGKSSKWHQSLPIDVTVALPSPRWGLGTPLSSLRMCDDTSKAVGRRSSANAHHYRQKWTSALIVDEPCGANYNSQKLAVTGPLALLVQHSDDSWILHRKITTWCSNGLLIQSLYTISCLNSQAKIIHCNGVNGGSGNGTQSYQSH